MGNDYLAGGDGADQMTGGLGDDRYQVNDPGDLMIEVPGEGRDVVEVESLASYTLPEHFEDLKLTDFGSVPVLTGVGNDANNELHGNGHDNILDGGRGNDRLWGGLARMSFAVVLGTIPTTLRRSGAQRRFVMCHPRERGIGSNSERPFALAI